MDGSIANITMVVLCALSFGLLLIRIGHSPIVGYIIAGIMLGPSCMKIVYNEESIHILSDLGILFLLFATGLNLSFEKLKKIWKSAFWATFLSAIAFIIIFYMIGLIFKWNTDLIIITTFCALPASTAVIVKSLKSSKLDDTDVGDTTIGISIVQDLFSLFMIISLKFMGNRTFSKEEMINFIISASICAIIVVFLVKYRKYFHKFANYLKKQKDILALCAVGLCLSGAMLSILSGFSAAFGSFIAGLALGNSELKEELKLSTATLEEILIMVFFLSIGLLVDIGFIAKNIWSISLSLIFITIGKTALNVTVFRLFKFPLKESFTIGVLLGHVGEFSFLIISEGFNNNLLDNMSRNFLISLTALSLFFSPFWLVIAQRCQQMTYKMNINSVIEVFRYTSKKEFLAIKKLYIFFVLIVVWIYKKLVGITKYVAKLFRKSKRIQ